ncbi:MAG TPA: Wzt carbohydrate-binding domain-containing protein, partial [Acidobacteriaceae bacterium]|nr:Wzt carbohydrate-binding domain-containing protein [Acidobacteriaceae bacterium]
KGEMRAIGDAKSVTEKYLASLFNQVQKDEQPNAAPRETVGMNGWRDQRRDLLAGSSLRNDLQVFQFNPNVKSFGQGGVILRDVSLCDEGGNPLSWVVGGEMVTLVIQAKCQDTIERPIVGFFVKDRLGQTLFGDNTYLTYLEAAPAVSGGGMLKAQFTFPMPTLPVGDYSFDVAVADGTQMDHRHLVWAHDVLIIRSVSTSVSTGLVGIPMLKMEIGVVASE